MLAAFLQACSAGEPSQPPAKLAPADPRKVEAQVDRAMQLESSRLENQTAEKPSQP